jgi:hypothetical protein
MAEAMGTVLSSKVITASWLNKDHCVRPEAGAARSIFVRATPMERNRESLGPGRSGEQNAAPAWYPEPRPAAIRIKVHIEGVRVEP